MRTASERFADVVNISANVKTFAANNAEIDFGKSDPIDRVAINMDEPWFPLDHFSLPRQFIKWDAAVFDGRNHGGHLVKIATKLFKGSANLIFIQRGNGPLIDHFSLSILCAGCDPEHERAGVFLVLAHEQILNLCAAPECEQEQTGGDGIERAAMADLFHLEFAPNERDHVVRRHRLGLVHEKNAVRGCSQRRHRLPLTLAPPPQQAGLGYARPRPAYVRRRQTSDRSRTRLPFRSSNACLRAPCRQPALQKKLLPRLRESRGDDRSGLHYPRK